ncbi:hypothetical protein ABT168_39555 [Streptomyces sp. NPDC001793]|uniref:hypothetical protein n=1 Tax=Streptomyces sp. NPDC001793 TaxID=3154657 RepID=UPI0033164F55
MNIVVQVKVLPEPGQAQVLAATLHKANVEANQVSAPAFAQSAEGRTRKALQHLAYADLKARGLSAQPALHVIRKVADAYATLQANIRAGNLKGIRKAKATGKPIRFRAEAAQSYDDRCLSWQYDRQTVSIWTTSGRMKGVRFVCSPQSLKTLRHCRKGESDLIARDGSFSLIATCEVPQAEQMSPDGWLGVDLGIVNIATTSDGERMAGRSLNRYRRRQLRLRAKLQRKGTRVPSAC